MGVCSIWVLNLIVLGVVLFEFASWGYPWALLPVDGYRRSNSDLIQKFYNYGICLMIFFFIHGLSWSIQYFYTIVLYFTQYFLQKKFKFKLFSQLWTLFKIFITFLTLFRINDGFALCVIKL